jgi:large subunit ribosomal protein L10e
MGLRPARCYKNAKSGKKWKVTRGFRKPAKQNRAFTRIAVKVPDKNYIGAAPALKIRQFNMGNAKGKYNLVADLKVKESFDLRDNAIESARQSINRQLVKVLGKEGFFMKVRVYPSNILRENKAAQGAGADRISQGMSLSFGKPNCRAARVKSGQIVYSVLANKGKEKEIKAALMRAKSRFSSDVKVDFHDDIKSVGTLPAKKMREEAPVVAPKTDDKAGAKKDEKAGAKPEAKKDEKKK